MYIPNSGDIIHISIIESISESFDEDVKECSLYEICLYEFSCYENQNYQYHQYYYMKNILTGYKWGVENLLVSNKVIITIKNNLKSFV